VYKRQHLQFSLQEASPETFGYTLVCFLRARMNIPFSCPLYEHLWASLCYWCFQTHCHVSYA